jgi:peptide/nickel transport system permease protein
MRNELGLNDAVVVQFARFLANILQGEFGISYRLQRPVAALIVERLPATLELVFTSALIALVLGIPLGVYTGIKREAWSSRLILVLSLIGVSLPTFVIGILLIYVFAVTLNVLPSYGRGEVVQWGFWSTGFLTVSGWKAIILPSVTLALFQMTLILRLVRAEMLEVMRTDYIKFARARGLPETAINYGHALKNALIPVITVVGLNIGSLVAFSIVTETVFNWPGLGFLFVQAISFADIPVMASYLLMAAVFFVTLNFIVDVLYFVVDPRLRTERLS